MNDSFFNTTNEDGAQLALFQMKARTQDERILEYFQAHFLSELTPSEVHEAIMPNAPLTSTRRAISNLTRQGQLRKTTTKRKGPFGRPEYCWRIA